MRSLILALSCTIAAALVACGGAATRGSDATTTPEPVLLSRGDACGDAFFWAATESGDIAVTVAMEATNRSRRNSASIAFELPERSVEVQILSGSNLAANFCTDVPSPESDPRERQDAAAGQGVITLDPATGNPCGSTQGELKLDHLVAQDGTTFTPIFVTSDSIGCYAG